MKNHEFFYARIWMAWYTRSFMPFAIRKRWNDIEWNWIWCSIPMRTHRNVKKTAVFVCFVWMQYEFDFWAGFRASAHSGLRILHTISFLIIIDRFDFSLTYCSFCSFILYPLQHKNCLYYSPGREREREKKAAVFFHSRLCVYSIVVSNCYQNGPFQFLLSFGNYSFW